jgi:hypothetical protein
VDRVDPRDRAAPADRVDPAGVRAFVRAGAVSVARLEDEL